MKPSGGGGGGGVVYSKETFMKKAHFEKLENPFIMQNMHSEIVALRIL